MESRVQLNNFIKNLKHEKGIRETIDFTDKYIEVIDGTAYVVIVCSEKDVDNIKEHVNIDNYIHAESVSSEKDGDESVVKYEWAGISEEIDI